MCFGENIDEADLLNQNPAIDISRTKLHYKFYKCLRMKWVCFIIAKTPA